MNKGLISAIMSTYNRGCDFLIQAIAAVQRQTYENWELIIIDDASSDNTEKIATKAQEQDKRIKYIRLKTNSGCVTIPRNIGIIHSCGEFIAHCDDDIIQFQNKFSHLIGRLNDCPDKDLAFGFRRAERMNQKGIYDIIGPLDYDPTVTWGVDGSQFLYRSSVYRDIPLVFCKRGCDWELMKAIWNNNPGFIQSILLVSQYDWHGGNRSLDNAGTKNRTYYPQEYEQEFIEYGGAYTYSLEPF